MDSKPVSHRFYSHSFLGGRHSAIVHNSVGIDIPPGIDFYYADYITKWASV